MSLLFRLKPLRSAKDRVLSRLNWTVTVRGRGETFRVPIRGGLGRLNRQALLEEGWMFPLIAAGLNRRPGLFVDVGVNVGQTLLKVKAVDRNQPYLGFEPDSAAVAYVRRLIRLNHLPHCRVAPVALAQAPGLLSLQTRDPGSAYATLIDGFRPDDFYQDQVIVPAFDGDGALARLAAGQIVSMVKIDVEGAELEVIRGLQRTLGRDRPSILCEILPTGLPGTTESARFDLRRRRQDELLAVLLKDLHYRMQRIAPDGTLVPLETIEPHDRMEWSQYWFD
jgi:FkbM family methyltransferase